MKSCRKSTNISCLLVQVQSMKEELQKKNNTKQTCRRRAECESRAGKQIGKAAAVRRCRWNLPLLRLTTLCSSGCSLHQSQGNRFTTLCFSVRLFVAYHSLGNTLLLWLQPTPALGKRTTWSDLLCTVGKHNDKVRFITTLKKQTALHRCIANTHKFLWL